ncbi:MAG TPA: 3-hydroxyacyl-CoA dehydrogenase family protein [Gaiellales bacterium]|jgi:3-hydroxybutyryl-CoA dehydrogenase|nr:3-hydroxyacyl-CoA dehydrogenase family protein [Gaiellales bacterium]
MEAITRVGVVGLGTMGAGIAQVLLEGGCEVVGRDVDDGALARARERIGAGLARRVGKGLRSDEERRSALARLTLAQDLAALGRSQLVIEAIVEEIGAKQALFAALDDICAAGTAFATNTSAISVTAIAAASARPERCLGLHFFNPAPLMPLVEVVRAERTGEEPYEAACALMASCGKQVVRCNDTPGFVVNRLLVPLLNDAVRALDETGVSPAEVDTAMTAGAGWPMGPFRLIDLVGIDVHVHAAEALHAALPEPRMAPPPRLLRMLEAGLLGRKTGRGFYDYASAE